ncbi:MAG: alpha/beta fold hydrolase, partial [Thermofilaceae archaeon]
TGSKSEAGRLYTDMARFLCINGYAALRFDFRCHGDSPLPFEEYRIRYGVEDALNAASYLKSLTRVDATRFAVVGLSMGAGIAVSLASNRDDVAALILLSGGYGLRGRPPIGMEKDGYFYLGALRRKAECVREDADFSVMELAERVRAPTLVIHSVDDEVAPISRAKEFYEKLTGEKKFVEVRGGHVFNDYHVRRQVESEVLAWLREYF